LAAQAITEFHVFCLQRADSRIGSVLRLEVAAGRALEVAVAELWP
jgi:hypothetical protein